ncbi:hypothetical protein EVAR_18162_1 [Eumeta japonica]|uniref:Uncharacterized protein n=1 Tax=Eumeta variegata TaxID=151549 RepID=A0A4C1UV33_EUMVA|nr:hypothetical protein EVAR_18162_1 [Eumeta japonica]
MQRQLAATLADARRTIKAQTAAGAAPSAGGPPALCCLCVRARPAPPSPGPSLAGRLRSGEVLRVSSRDRALKARPGARPPRRPPPSANGCSVHRLHIIAVHNLTLVGPLC